MNKSVVLRFALEAATHGYRVAATEIKKSWNEKSDWDIDWALRIAYLSDKFGYPVAKGAVDNPEMFDNRTAREKIIDTISGNNAHLNPDYEKESGLREVPKGIVSSWQQSIPSKEDCGSIADLINRGTQDILEHPELDPSVAIANGNFLRGIKDK